MSDCETGIVDILTEKQQQKLLELAPARTKLILETLLQTGCTTDEIRNIKVADIQNTSIRIQQRQTTISQELALRLKSAKGEYVFSTRQSPQITARRLQQLVKQAVKHVKNASPQALRYANIANRHKQGQTHEQIARQVGLTVRRVQEIVGEFAKPQKPLKTTPKGRDQLIAETILQTGCSISELTNLKKSHFSSTSLTIGKRSVRTTASFAKQLRSYMKTHPSEYLFTSRQAEKLTNRRVQQILAQQHTTAQKKRYQSIARKEMIRAINDTGLSKRRVAQIRAQEEQR